MVITADTESVYRAVRAKYFFYISGYVLSVMIKHLAMKMHGEQTYSCRYC